MHNQVAQLVLGGASELDGHSSSSSSCVGCERKIWRSWTSSTKTRNGVAADGVAVEVPRHRGPTARCSHPDVVESTRCVGEDPRGTDAGRRCSVVPRPDVHENKALRIHR